MVKRIILLPVVVILLLLGLLGSSFTVMAQDEVINMPEGAVGGYSIDGVIHWLYPGEEVNGFLVVSEEEYEQMKKDSPENEANIIHQIPPCPVIIDGVMYEPEEIHLFDGQRLGFTVGNDGMLYAFTSEEGMEKFQQEQNESKADRNTENGNIRSSDILSYFYEDWFYSGDYCYLAPGYCFLSLGPLNDMITSFKANSAASKVRLYEHIYFGGDYFERPGGDCISTLVPFGWNDRTSSIVVYQ